MHIATALCACAVGASCTLAQVVQSEEAPARAPESHYAMLDGHKVHYVDSGDGNGGESGEGGGDGARKGADEAIVLVHGWASDWTLLRPQFEGLADTARVIAVDLPGHGKSDAPEIEYTMDLFAKGIAAVLDDAGVERAVLVGHSNGVPTIRQFYRNYRDRTLGLVCLDGALFSVFPREQAERMFAMFEGEDYRDVLESMCEPLLAMSSMPQEQKAHVKEVMLATPQHVLLGAARAGIDPEIWIDDKVEVPMLVINAPNPMWSAEYLEKIEGLGENVEVQNWERVSHMLMLEESERVNAQVTAFLYNHKLVN